MRLQGVALRWSEVPVLVEGVEGDVVVRWSERASSVKDEPLHHVRPFGVAYRLGNTGAGRVGAQVGAHGWVREESQPSTLERAQLPLPLIQEIELDLPGLGLRGRDFNVLATRFPPLGRQVEDLGARGLVQGALPRLAERARPPVLVDDRGDADGGRGDAALLPAAHAHPGSRPDRDRGRRARLDVLAAQPVGQLAGR
jgi:hypothetical protein